MERLGKYKKRKIGFLPFLTSLILIKDGEKCSRCSVELMQIYQRLRLQLRLKKEGNKEKICASLRAELF